ncbi:hypothetical protein [Hamadaea tsunoensis]|uniref:hypothetical protein n=1 Tax=Hamadaea tsunoensis TaxID=53368 RepID=UPI0004259C48|nr:hypothetical protein [Hamadaea tsunoensis]
MESDSPVLFFIYVAILGLTGLAFIALGVVALVAAVRERKGGKAVLMAVLAIGFLGFGAAGYAGYLVWEYLTKEYFEYTLYWKVMIIPVVVLIAGISALRDHLRKKKAAAAERAKQPVSPVQPG